MVTQWEHLQKAPCFLTQAVPPICLAEAASGEKESGGNAVASIKSEKKKKKSTARMEAFSQESAENSRYL